MKKGRGSWDEKKPNTMSGTYLVTVLNKPIFLKNLRTLKWGH